MNKLQSYLSSLDSTTTVSEEDVQNTLALLNMYAPLVRQSVRRLDEFSMQCYDSRRQSISDFINLAIDFDQDADRKRIADRLASMGHSLQLLELLEEALVLVKEDPRHDGIYYRILKARYFNVYCRSNEDAFLDAGVSSSTYYRHIKDRKSAIRAAFQEDQGEVELLPPRDDLTEEHKENAIVRVAAYCRVSTLSEMQAESFEIQLQYYTELIARHPNWELVKVYADEGISATSVKNRKSFNKMLEDCREGKIDLIITKSVSRFARNVVDCIDTARELKKLVPPVGVLFETENINTIDQNGELLLTVLAAFAQDESVNKSISVAWGFRQRFAKGIVKMRKVYGYTVVGNRLEVVEKEFRIVQEIYRLYLHGKSTGEIAKILTEQRVPTPTGRAKWTASTVGYIIGNDKNAGDVIMQKTYCVDLFSHKRVRNYGKVQRYRKSNTHTPAISRDLWRKAKNRLMLSHREVEIVEEPAGDGWRKDFHRIRFKDDIDVIQSQGSQQEDK